MKEKSLKNLKPWKPGESGNLSGKPKNLLTKDQVHAVLGRFSTLTVSEIKAISENPKSPMLEAMVASIMLKAVENGDPVRVDFLWNRSIGKVKDEVQITESKEKEELRKLSLKELIVFAKTHIPEALE